MKTISVINTSYMSDSKTMGLVSHFLRGLNDILPEIQVNFFNISDWQFQTCTGCGNCWFKEPGECVFKDDFSKNLKNVFNADTLIFSNPIWVGSGNHLFRNFTERMICLFKPDFELNEDRFGHKKSLKTNFNKILLFSSCALPGLHNFDPIIEHYKSFKYLMNLEIDNPLLKPQSIETIYYNSEEKQKLSDLCYGAGVAYAKNNQMDKGILEDISKSILSTDQYINLMNDRQLEIRQNQKKIL